MKKASFIRILVLLSCFMSFRDDAQLTQHKLNKQLLKQIETTLGTLGISSGMIEGPTDRWCLTQTKITGKVSDKHFKTHQEAEQFFCSVKDAVAITINRSKSYRPYLTVYPYPAKKVSIVLEFVNSETDSTLQFPYIGRIVSCEGECKALSYKNGRVIEVKKIGVQK